MSDTEALCIVLLCATISLGLVWRWKQNATGLPFPPGPNGLPLIGNVLDIPKDVPIWQTFTSLGRKFDTDVLYLRLLTTDFIVLNSSEAILNLPDKRSNIYCNRPRIPMFELMGQYDWSIAMMEYGSYWRNGRRLLHEFLNARAVTRFDDYHRKHAHRLVLGLADSPEAFADHTDFEVASLIMEMTYGFNITSNKDKFLRAAVDALELSNKAVIPGAFLVDTLPILKYTPEWFPGAGFKTFAREARDKLDLLVNGTLRHVKELMKSGGSNNPSIAWSCLNRRLESGDQGYDEKVIRSATATIFLAAMDTTAAILHTFFLAMALNPHVVKKAQDELDRVVGSERLPDFSDQDNLPYISAIVKEVLRWGCTVPIGVPKCVAESHTYNGRFIPMGATVVENIWAIFYDESIYPAPYTFDPERFLKDGKLNRSVADPEERIFGPGRRVCPGKYFALRALFLNMACILSIFNIEAPTGEKLEAKFHEESLIRHPVKFKCTVKPRSEASLRLGKSAADH